MGNDGVPMLGPGIVVRTLSTPGIPDDYGNVWQYHSRSDRHSKVACWAVTFDLLRESGLLREHVDSGKVVIGINHRLRDFQTQRDKDLDLVIGVPGDGSHEALDRSFHGLADLWRVDLSGEERRLLAALPDCRAGVRRKSRTAAPLPIGSVLVALEAKAAMTAHVKALPRLHDELDSSHQTVHGNSERALAAGYVLVNASTSFISPGRNAFDLSTAPPVVNEHTQPAAAERVVGKVSEIRRRSGSSGSGFDAIGITVIELRNDGSPVVVAPDPDPVFRYDDMIRRIAHEYAAAFSRL